MTNKKIHLAIARAHLAMVMLSSSINDCNVIKLNPTEPVDDFNCQDLEIAESPVNGKKKRDPNRWRR